MYMVFLHTSIVTKAEVFYYEIMECLYAIYRVKQSTTTSNNQCGNSECERFNHTIIDVLKSLLKEQKSNWALHLPSLMFTYNVMPHSTTHYQPYELTFGHKVLGWPVK